MNELASQVRVLLPKTFTVKPETSASQINEWITAILNARRELKRASPMVYARLCSYTATAADVGQVDLLASLCNLAPGPVLFRVASKGGGYGLFAEQDYAAGRESVITRYDGVRFSDAAKLPPREEADYMFDVTAHDHIDGKYGFRLENKGRWFNEPNAPDGVLKVGELNALTNVEMARPGLFFFPHRGDIRRGTELEWYYGPFYLRPWLRILQTDELPARRKRLKP